jgi:signal transduction histidine kinase
LRPNGLGEGRYFRPAFVSGDAIRAFLIFGAATLALVGAAAQLVFREAGLNVLISRLELIRHEADTIARVVVQIGGEGRSIDFSRVRQRRPLLVNLIHQRMAVRPFMHHVEVQDRFGVRQLFIVRAAADPEPHPPVGMVPVDWPGAGEQIIGVPLGAAEGEVRVGLSPSPLLAELERLQRSLRIKVVAATALALFVLIAGFFYVLYLLRKNRMLEESRQSAIRAAERGLLASGLAHENRNPLNAMNINLQLLEEELQGNPAIDQADVAELLESAKSEIQRLEGLVNNVLTFARPPQPQFEAQDMNRVVSEVLRFLEADFRQNEVKVTTDLEPLLPEIELDGRQLKQALINILVNANQVLERGGLVRVRTRAGSRGEVVVEIEDNGPGIPADVQDRIFDVFYSRRGGGTGLGLPIARQIVERHGGAIEMESEEGQGTLFRLRLPRRQERARSAAETA